MVALADNPGTHEAVEAAPVEAERLSAKTRDGAALAYRQVPGSGIAIVDPLSYAATLRGLEQAHGQRDFLLALGAGHQLVYFDQRGSGDSCPGVPDGWEQRADDLWAVVDAAGIERAVLYGVFDAGATVAYAAAQRPERVLGLIFNRVPALFATTGNDGDGSQAAMLDDWFTVTPDAPHGRAMHLMEAIGISQQDAETLVQTWEETADGDVVAKHADLFRAADLRTILPKLELPALVLASKRRRALAAWGEALGRLLPAGRVVYADNAGEALGAVHAFLTILGADVGRMASHLSPALSTTMTDTRRSIRAVRRIIVPVDASVPSGRAVELACRLGEAQKAEIVLAHVVVVPHARPIDHPLPEATLRGRRALTLGEAIAGEHGLPVRTLLLRERSAASAIVRLAKEEVADLIVLPLGEQQSEGNDQVGRTVQEILRRSPCEVLMDRGAVR